jgi:dynein heavy chain
LIEFISASIKFGKKILIENAGEEINRALYPLFDTSMLQDDGDEKSIYLKNVMIPIHPDFKLYICSELKNPRFSLDIAVFANFVNFSVTQEGLEAQLLSQIVGHKIAKLEKNFQQIKVEALECIVRLQNSEDQIL